MSRSTVSWDTRCLLTRFACRKNMGHATSRRSAGTPARALLDRSSSFRLSHATSEEIGRRRERECVVRRTEARREGSIEVALHSA